MGGRGGGRERSGRWREGEGTLGRADIQTNFCTVVMEGKQDEGVPLL